MGYVLWPFDCAQGDKMELAFVLGGFVKGDEVDHTSKAGADSVAVGGFYFGSGEVCRDVGLDFFGDEKVVSRE